MREAHGYDADARRLGLVRLEDVIARAVRLARMLVAVANDGLAP